MIISATTHLPFPRSIVYSTYRDRLVDLLPYLPDIKRIEVKSRHLQDGLLYVVNEWQGGGEIPLLARAILSESMLSWTDHGTWNDAEFTTDWRTETHAFTEAVYCVGKNNFFEEGSGTRIVSKGTLSIDPQKITGVPSFLAGKVAQTTEDFLGKKIEPTFIQIGQGIRRYLDSQKA